MDIPKATKTRARTALRKSGQDYSEEDVERKAEELHQKYLANKEKASKRAEKRETKQLAKEHMITIAVLPEGSPEVDLPRFYAVEKTKNIKYKKKNGQTVTKQEKQYKLVNPLTKQRNIAQRQGSKPINLKRKDVDEVAVENTIVKTIPLDRFVPADQKKAFIYNKKRAKLDEEGVAPKDRPDKSAFEVKERGRPEILPKNVAWHTQRGSSKLNEKKLAVAPLRQRREDEETKEETHQEEEKDGYEPPPRLPHPQDPQAKKKGRPKKYQTEEEAKKAKTAMTVASNRRRYQEKKEQLLAQVEKIKQLKLSEKEKKKRIKALNEQTERLAYAITHPKQLPPNPNPRGEGIMDSLNAGVGYLVDKGKKAVSAVTGKAKQIGNTLSQVVTGATDFSPSVRKILEAEGNNIVKRIVVGRTPVQKAITMALNLVSQGKFQENQDELNYDKLYHLFAEVYLDNGKQVRVEKNEVITMTMGNFKQDPDTDRQEVPMTEAISFRDMIHNARQKMGGKFFAYDSANNNCQDFIMAFLQGSGLGTQENYTFIKQDTKSLFKGLTKTRAVAKQVTNLGQRANIALNGGKLKKIISSNVIMPKFAKGSQEARDHMAKIRSMRKGRSKPKEDSESESDSDEEDRMEGRGTGDKLAKNLAGNTGRLADAGTNKLISMMGTGVHIHHHHYTPHSYEGGNLGLGVGGTLGYSNAGVGRGVFDEWVGRAKQLKVPHSPQEALHQAKLLQSLTPSGTAMNEVSNVIKKARGGKINRLKKFNRWTGAIGNVLGDVADYVKPVAKPILEAGTKKAVEAIGNYAVGGRLKKGSKEAREHMARIRAMRKK